MPGGNPAAWPAIKPIFQVPFFSLLVLAEVELFSFLVGLFFHRTLALQAICAKSGEEPCCDWVGEDGSGHFVKVSFHQHVLPPMDTLMLILLGYNTFNFISLIP